MEKENLLLTIYNRIGWKEKIEGSYIIWNICDINWNNIKEDIIFSQVDSFVYENDTEIVKNVDWNYMLIVDFLWLPLMKRDVINFFLQFFSDGYVIGDYKPEEIENTINTLWQLDNQPIENQSDELINYLIKLLEKTPEFSVLRWY